MTTTPNTPKRPRKAKEEVFISNASLSKHNYAAFVRTAYAAAQGSTAPNA